MKRIVWIGIFLLSIISISARIPINQKQRLTENWLYLKGDLGNIWEAVRPKSAGSSESVPRWEKMTLPHCFNAKDGVDPDTNYYQGPGWYKTLLDIKKDKNNDRIFLEFEGAGQKTQVFIYTTLVGSHVGGYDEWDVDITEAVHEFIKDEKLMKLFNGKIPLSIRCDNSRDTEMIPSDLADFNIYGGLYRYVNLLYLPEVAFHSIKIESDLSSDLNKGTVTISGSFINPNDIKKADIDIDIIDNKNQVITNASLKDILPLGLQNFTTFTIKRPSLWDVNNPTLYTCRITLHANGQSLTTDEKFGFRQYEFKEQGPFFLNGKRLLLRGTHRHEDHAGTGQAMTEDLMRKEMTLMKNMGVNFIRLGHYQQSNIILNLCDELGILVWEEIPWCRGGLGGDSYKSQAKRMLTNMISQHHNHPSIIIWGLGNENDWPNDFNYFKKDQIRAFMKELNDLAHHLDNTRKTAIRRCEFCKDIVDVYSPSIWAGWYRGVFTDYKSISETEMKKVKHFLHVEWGGDSHARRHSENVFANLKAIKSGQGGDERAGDASLYGGQARASKDGDWSESYIVRLIDWHLKEQETMPWLTGTAYWPFKDFSTPVRPENPVPYVNQKGVIERDFTLKESYFVFQSYWTTRPMIHIYGHTWPVRWGDVNEKKEVLVYSNCEEVELFVNNISQGKKKRNSQDYPAAGLHWYTSYNKGKNIIRAVGYKNSTQIEDSIVQEYQIDKWGKATSLKLQITEKDNDFVTIEAQLYDKNNIRCLDAKNWILFGITGDGQLLDNLGTSTGSRKVQAYNGRAIIKVRRNNGKSVVSVKSKEIPTTFLSL